MSILTKGSTLNNNMICTHNTSKLDLGIVKTRENYKLACQRTFPEVLFWVRWLF